MLRSQISLNNFSPLVSAMVMPRLYPVRGITAQFNTVKNLVSIDLKRNQQLVLTTILFKNWMALHFSHQTNEREVDSCVARRDSGLSRSMELINI